MRREEQMRQKQRSHYSTKALLQKVQKKIYSVESPMHPLLLPVLLGFFMLVDGLTIYQLIEQMFYQAQWLSIIVTIGIAAVLEGVPYVAAQYIMREEKKKSDYVVLITLAVSFAILFFSLFALRWNTQDLLYSTADSEIVLDVMNQASTETVVQEESNAGQQAMTFLLGISPLLTSILAFALSCFQVAASKRNNIDVENDIELMERMKLLRIFEQETTDEIKRDLLGYDQKLLAMEMEKLDTYAAILKNIVRQRVAMKTGSPEMVSKLLEGEN